MQAKESNIEDPRLILVSTSSGIEASMGKPERVRDPLHDLIEFSIDDFEQFAWSLVQTREFQRLRRVRQLGFCELVYPGATHSRWIHSLGVFHTARVLLRQIGPQLRGGTDPERTQTALTAALLHDLGHGPFSHAFEEATKQLDRDQAVAEGRKPDELKKHEVWTADIITGDTDVGALIVDRKGEEFRSNVAKILLSDVPEDIYAAVVSSQFDADRLDYSRRDRLMTGVRHGEFDYSWLLANLEVGNIPLATDGERFGSVDSIVLGHKALQAGEGYVLGLFHLYFTVYFHKAIRAAEKMLTGILRRIGSLCRDGNEDVTGLKSSSPIINFVKRRDLSSYLRLDDYVVWASLGLMSDSSDPVLSRLSKRLVDRKLYKAIDISARGGAGQVADFRIVLSEAVANDEFEEGEIFQDRPSRNPYERKSFGSPDALKKIYIRRPNSQIKDDLRDRSDVVKALEEKALFRVYVRDDVAQTKVERLTEGILG